MFITEGIDELHAETAGSFTVEYTPSAPHEVRLRMTAPMNAIRFTGVEASLFDGTILAAAVRLQQREDAIAATVDLGYLEVPVRVKVAVRAVVPVCRPEATIQVLADDLREVFTVPLTGKAKFVPSRSVIHVPDRELHPNEAVAIDVSLINDGTAIATGARLHFRPPAWTNVDAEGVRRELNRTDGPMMVLALPDLPVGATSRHRFRATLAPVIQDGTAVTFEAFVTQGERRFDLSPVTSVVRSHAKLQASVKLTEERAFRYGERVAALITLRAQGSDVARGVRVTLASAAIAWNDATDGTALTLDFGDVPPLTDTAHLVQGTVISTPPSAEDVEISLSAQAEGASVEADSCAISVAGAPQVSTTLFVHELPDEAAYEVVCQIHNDGDGEASSVVVRSQHRENIVGVVDSLIIDGQSRLSLDGSIAVEHGGVEVGVLPILSSRDVRWKIRSSADHDIALAVDVIVDGTTETVEAPRLSFSAGHRSQYIAPIAPPTLPTWADLLPVIAPAAAIQPEAGPVVAATEAQDVPVAAESAEEAGADEAVSFEVGVNTVSRWKAWFGEYGPSADVELGRYVLAAREFLPIRANGEEKEATLSALRTECNSVVTARLFSWKSTGTIGASGYDFGTPALRANVAAFWNMLGQPQSNLEGARLDQAIVALTAANGTDFSAEVDAFRDRLIEVLENVQSIEAYGEAVPELQPAASRLFNAMCDLGVAA